MIKCMSLYHKYNKSFIFCEYFMIIKIYSEYIKAEKCF